MHPGTNSISERHLIDGVLKYFEQLLDGADFSFTYHTAESDEPELPDEKSIYEKELEKIDQRKARIKEAYEAGIDSLEEYKENRERLTAEAARIAGLIQELEAAEPVSPAPGAGSAQG